MPSRSDRSVPRVVLAKQNADGTWTDVLDPTPVGGAGGGGGLTDAQLRATPVPVSGPLTDAQLRATAVPVSGTVTVANPTANPETGLAKDGTDGSAPPAVLGAGTGIRGWLRSIYEKLTGTIAVSGTFWQATQPVSGTFWQATQPVSGPLTDAQLRATAVPVSATQLPAALAAGGGMKVEGVAGGVAQPVSGTFWQATQPVSGTFWQATQPVDTELPAAAALADTTANPTTPSTGSLGMVWNGTTWDRASGTAAGGAKVNSAQLPTALAAGGGMKIEGVAGGVAVPVSGPVTNLQRQQLASTTGVTVTAAAGVAATLTLAASASNFHYITHLEITAYSTVARVGGTTPVLVTTTNLPGSPVWTFASAAAVGTTASKYVEPGLPLRSSVVNTATTIVCPATTSVIWRIIAYYYLAA